MANVNTVLGPISTDELGLTLIHEHLTLAYPGWECDALAVPYDREAIAKTCVEALEEAKAYGVNTMVDASPNDLYRDVELDRMVSERAGINIICATGLYTEYMGKPAYFKFRSQVFDITTEIYETFMREITQGIGADCVVEAVGHYHLVEGQEAPLAQAVDMIRTGGRIVTAGLGDQLSAVHFKTFVIKEAKLIGSRVTLGEFSRAILLLEKGLLHPELLVTDEMRMRDISAAFERVDQQDPRTIKVVLNVQDM